MNFDFNFNFNFGITESKKKIETFEEFCELAGYPKPFPKQEEMRNFAFPEDDNKKNPRLILGARGYGKTDYVTILGLSYHFYKNPESPSVLMTKEFERGKEIMQEIAVVLERVGVKKNLNVIDIVGQLQTQQIQEIQKVAKGWDIEHLAKVYVDGINSGKREPPNSISKAFPKWCENYTKKIKF